MTGSGFEFLKEKPLESIKEISDSKFGHEEIAVTLEKITEKCPTPFTIGLFAKWGSGKSTIANSLKRKLHSKKIPVVLFDVWKHEGDALRRTFLKEIVKQLQGDDFGNKFFSDDFKLNDRLERSVSTSSDTKLKINTEKLKQFLFWVAIGAVIVGIVALILWYTHHLKATWDFLKPSILSFAGVTGGGAFVIWLLKQSVYFFSSETTNYGVDKFEDPHEFEEEFSNILRALKNPRIVIVFDNLDRVTHDKVAEILSTIKTFLEPRDIEDDKKEVVFLVPCDAKSIKHHLANLYGSSQEFTFDPDEFLRKFFNTIVWIPDFIPVELESLAKESLKDTKVPVLDDDYVAWIITKAFRENPRQIIQFINILLANYLLVVERQGDDKDFPADFLKDNISQLAKYLILIQMFPDEMEILRNNKILDLEDAKTVDWKKSKRKEEFLKFLEETRGIPILNLRIFFTLRRSKQEKSFPGFESFVTLLEDRKVDEAKNYLEKIADFNSQQTLDNFTQAIKTEIENKTNPVSLANLVSTLFAIISENHLTLAIPLFQEVSNILNGICKGQLHLLSPKSVNEVLFARYSTDRLSLVTQWITALEGMASSDVRYQSNRSFIKEAFEVLTNNPEYTDAGQSTRVRQLIENYHAKDIEIVDLVTRNNTSQKKFLSSQCAKSLLESLAGNQIPETVTRLGLLSQFDDSFTNPVGADTIFEKFSNLITVENQIPATATTEKRKQLDALNDFIQKHIVLMQGASDSVKNTFIDLVIVSFNSLPNHEERSLFLPMLVDMKKYAPVAKVSDIDNLLSGYIGGVNPESFNQAYSELPSEERTKFFESALYAPAETRAIKEDLFRQEFFSKITDTQKQLFVEKLFQQNVDGAFQFIEKLDPKENKNIFSMFDKIWTIYDGFSASNKKRMFDFVNSRKADNNAHVRDVLANKISTCLIDMDPATQEVGLQGFSGASSHLSKPRLRQIAKDTFDWLRKPEVTPKYQLYTLRAVQSEYDQFNEEEKGEFIQFVFEELIRKSNDVVHISFGFETLGELKVKYEERAQNFDDVKLRIDSEQNTALKSALLDGLIKLKPTRTNADNKDYWNSIDDILSPKEELGDKPVSE